MSVRKALAQITPEELAEITVASAAAAAYTAAAVNSVGGSNYVLAKSGVSITPTKFILISCWWKGTAGTDASSRRLIRVTDNSGTNFVNLQLDASNRLVLGVVNGSGTLICSIASTTTALTADGNWHHLFATAQTDGGSNKALYIDGVNQSLSITTFADGTAGTPTRIAAFTNHDGSATVAGSLAEVYLNVKESSYFNPSGITSFASGGKPVSLGASGATPTGTSPDIYLKNAAASFGTNSGTGGNLTITGTLTDVTPP